MYEQRDRRIATLQSEIAVYDTLYWKAPFGSRAMYRYENKVLRYQAEHDALCRERDDDWGKDDDYLLGHWGKKIW